MMSNEIDSRPVVCVAHPCSPKVIERLREHCKVVWHSEAKLTTGDFMKAISGADAILMSSRNSLRKETLDAAGPQLKVVGTMSVGLDHIDLVECKRRGVKIGYTANVLTTAVAEMVVGLTLATARRLEEALQSVHRGVWGTEHQNALWMTGKQIYRSVIGIVGLGQIGLAAAKRLKAFEPSRIVYCGRSFKQSGADIGAEFVSFDELLDVSDIVIATCSINETSRGLFSADAFKKMKSSAIFINVTRGALVDQDALYTALTTNEIAAAGLDVTTPEPLSPDHKLLSLPNCTVTPHVASATVVARNDMCDLTVDNILAGLRGHALPSPAY